MKFSIIVPVYMSEPYIESCIKSLLSQDFTDFELLIIDDSAPDRSIDICRRLTQNDSRASIYSIPHSGVSRARNEGISRAKGEYILFVDSDDSVQSDYLSRLASSIYNYDIYTFGYNFTFFNGKTKTVVPKSCGVIPSEKAVCCYSSGYGNAVWNKAFKRSFLMKNRLSFDENISMGEDLLFVYSCALKTDIVYALPYAIYNYTQRHNTLSSQIFTANDSSAEEALNKTYTLLSGNVPALREFDLYITEAQVTNLTKICSSGNLYSKNEIKPLKKRLLSRAAAYLKASEPSFISKANALIMCISPGLWRFMHTALRLIRRQKA